MAMLDKEISKIHSEMKESLEDSFYSKENEKNNVWKWEINKVDEKLHGCSPTKITVQRII